MLPNGFADHFDSKALKPSEFRKFQKMLYDRAGIHLSDAKMSLVSGRLANRVRYHKLSNYGDYFRLISSSEHSGELQIAIDLLTTNETWFFREPAHFDLLAKCLPRVHARAHRVWSAACSSGEEPYSIAMTLAETWGTAPWMVVGTDLSTRVLDTARRGIYPMARAEGIPQAYLSKYCLKGIEEHEGTFMVAKSLRDRIRFSQANLNGVLPRMEHFDVIFLRNVMIYFDQETKRKLVEKLTSFLHPGGYLLVGHSETLHGLTNELVMVRPSVYRKMQ